MYMNTVEAGTTDSEVDLSDLVAPPPEPPDELPVGPPAARPAEADACPERLARIFRGGGPAPDLEVAGELVGETLRLLGVVGGLRAQVEREGASSESKRRLAVVRGEAHRLLASVEMAELRVEEPSEELVGALEGTAFLFSHELRRGPAGGEWHAGAGRAEFLRVCALLENCLQQGAVTLARVFDPSLTREEVFEDFEARRAESRTLLQALTALAESVRRAEESSGVLQGAAALAAVRRFRREHLHLLMYADWEVFEGLADEAEAALGEDEAQAVYHRFAHYLETLSLSVSMRAALQREAA